jgi:hypothetical protein
MFKNIVKGPVGRPRRKWVDIIEMDLGEIGSGIDWIGLTHDRTSGELL